MGHRLRSENRYGCSCRIFEKNHNRNVISIYRKADPIREEGMLLHEKEHLGFLGDKLLQAAEAIVNDGIYPDWESEEN